MNFLIKVTNNLLFRILQGFSLLPMPMLYGISKVLFIVLYFILRYRRKIVQANLKSSLPPSFDINLVEKEFYWYLSEMFVETIKCLTITKKSLLSKIYCDNPEILEPFVKENKSVIIMSAHYCNWEWLIYSMNLLFDHQAVGVGKKLSNQELNRLTNEKRSKFGLEIIHAQNIKTEFLNFKNKLTATLFLSDQYPGGVDKGYPSVFLNKPTSFLYGAEKYAKTYDYPVLYADFERISQGKYKVHLIKITDHPQVEEYGFIMSKYINYLEETILRAPQYWLWSHKRWKNIEGFY